jgi:hypothetical protein
MMTAEETGWVVAITGGATTLLTIAFTKGVDALLRLRKSSMDAQKQDDDGLVAGYKLAIDNLKVLFAEVEADRQATTKAHAECLKNTGVLTGKVDFLIDQNDKLLQKVIALQSQVDMLTRHEQRNAEQLEVWRREIGGGGDPNQGEAQA